MAAPPLRPASLAASDPSSKDPLDAWPPLDAISFCSVSDVLKGYEGEKTTNLLVGIHACKSAFAGLSTLLSSSLDVLLGAVGKVAGVVAGRHVDGYVGV